MIIKCMIIFIIFYRELRLQHVRMTRDRKSHEKKVSIHAINFLLLILVIQQT